VVVPATCEVVHVGGGVLRIYCVYHVCAHGQYAFRAYVV
jgi:hypothetical protein